jgi:hypothetical protein
MRSVWKAFPSQEQKREHCPDADSQSAHFWEDFVENTQHVSNTPLAAIDLPQPRVDKKGLRARSRY